MRACSAMANSRKPAPKAEGAGPDAELLAILAGAIGDAAGPLAIAFSGGADSTVLLELACLLRQRGTAAFEHLLAIHVHHGLTPLADEWARQCAAHCAARGVAFALRRVAVAAQAVARGRGIEDAARQARYAALDAAARAAGAPWILTAHHRDDRIETFLLQWLRGAGPEGLAGPARRRMLDRRREDGPWLLRPLLDVGRARLAAFAARHRLHWVSDPSNESRDLARNALRHDVLPRLGAIRSGYLGSTARAIDLIAEMAATLHEVAREDLARCEVSGGVALEPLLALTPARRAGVLRAWLDAAGIEAPSRARLANAISILTGGAPGLARRFDFGALQARRERGVLRLGPALVAPAVALPPPARLRWGGEAEVALPVWAGKLRFVPTTGDGVDAAWLRGADLEVRHRRGGERFKPHPARPSKTLKQIYQEAGLDLDARRALPLVWCGADLLYVAGVGCDARRIGTGGARVRLEWISDAGAGATRLI